MQLLRSQRLHRVGGQHRQGQHSLDLGAQERLRTSASAQPATFAAAAACASTSATAHAATAEPAAHAAGLAIATSAVAAASIAVAATGPASLSAAAARALPSTAQPGLTHHRANSGQPGRAGALALALSTAGPSGSTQRSGWRVRTPGLCQWLRVWRVPQPIAHTAVLRARG